VRALSKINTNDIRVLIGEVPDNYRLTEPLVLYTLSVNKCDCFLRTAKDPHLLSAFRAVEEMSWDDVLSLLKCEDKRLTNEFHKVYRSYKSIRDKQKHVNHTKSLVLNRIRELQNKKNVTTYRLYTDLGLNHGNVHAYIKNGDVSKVSLEVAENILTYLEAA